MSTSKDAYTPGALRHDSSIRVSLLGIEPAFVGRIRALGFDVDNDADLDRPAEALENLR